MKCETCKYGSTNCYLEIGHCEEFSQYEPKEEPEAPSYTVRGHNVGNSDYSTRKIQPWDIWLEYKLNPWDADIVKRVLRNKTGESRVQEYNKIIHICEERVRQLTI